MREELTRPLLALLLRQIMPHGLLHADPHPGDVMLRADGRTGARARRAGGRVTGCRDSCPAGRCAARPPGPHPRGCRRREPEVCLGGRG
ncbi:AarF/UbiB family protein [Streptosporangium canum]